MAVASELTPDSAQGARARYLVIEEVGRGASGVVLRAYDSRLQREVALESLRAALTPEARTRMLRVAVAMAQLSHPNIVGVYDVDVSGEEVWMALEYVRGPTLAAWLDQPRSWREVLDCFLAAGRGLAAAHEVGITHGAFEASRVLIGADGRVRVRDFGLGRSFENNPATHPAGVERPAAEGLEQSSDQFAFCVAFWTGLTGQPPPSHREGAAVRRDKRPTWPRHVAGAVPRAIREALRRGLSASPHERWPTMQALLDRLEDANKTRHLTWLGAGGMVLATAAASTAWGAYRDLLVERCSGASGQLETIWSPARRQRVQQSFEETGVEQADTIGQSVFPKLDHYASTWSAAYTEACEATTVRGEQTPEVMDLQMACLHRAKVDLRAVTDLLTRADAQVVETAERVVGSLPRLERCADVEALRAAVAPPAPVDAEAVEAVRVELAEIKALREAGKYPDVLARMQPLEVRARAIPYRPLLAEMLIELGFAHNNVGAYGEAHSRWAEALRSALASKQWSETFTSASLLVHTLCWQHQRPREALAHAETAKAFLGHVGVAADAEATIRLEASAALEMLGRYTEAEVEIRAATVLAEQAYGPQHVELATYHGRLGLNLLDQGRLPEAEVELRKKLAVRLATWTSDHPEVAHARYDLAAAISRQGRYAEAESELRQARATFEKTLGADHYWIGLSGQSIASLLHARGDHAAAEQEFRRAIANLSKTLPPEHAAHPRTQGNLASVISALGRHDEAEKVMRAAVVAAQATHGASHLSVAELRSRLIELLIAQEAYASAEAEARTALAALAGVAGHPMIPSAHDELGVALHAQGRYAEAQSQFEAALRLAEGVSGRQELANMHNHLGSTLQAQERHDEAEREHRLALSLLTGSVGGVHPDVATTHGRIAHTLRAQGRLDAAEAEYRRGLALLQRSVHPSHPRYAELHGGLGRVLLERGNADEALAVLESASATWVEDRRVTTEVRARLAFDLARASLAVTGDHRRARRLAREALARFGTKRDEIHAWLETLEPA